MNLEISGLVQRFGTTRVLDGLDLRTGDVRSLVLVGPSGGGKSTLLRILAGLDVPVEGSVTFDGDRLPRDERSLRAYRRTVGTVFQAYNLFPHLTALDNLLLPLIHVHGLSDSVARRVSRSRSSGFISPNMPTSGRPNSPAGRNSGSPSCGPSSCVPGDCSSTSQPRHSIRR